MNINLERTGTLQEGNYKVRIESLEEAQGPSGHPYLKMTYMVLDKTGKPTDQKLWDNLSFNPKARFKVDQFLDAIGAAATGTMSAKSLRGKTLWVTLGKRTWQGTVRNDITQYLTEEQAEKGDKPDVPEYKAPVVSDEGDKIKAFTPSSPMDDDEEEEGGLEMSVPDEMEEGEDIPF